MRLTTRTNLAMRTLMFCAINPDRSVRKQDVAEACNASENHLAQVVNQLAQLGFLTTQRGRNGGIALGLPPDRINVGTLFRAFESGLPFAECFGADENRCPLAPACRLRDALGAALEAFYGALDSITLADLVDSNDPLTAILTLDKPACTSRPACRAAC
ncbi:RrF2 family transcriptional regulator [Plastorhodobacter daqingensis]|uniref:RrF2 family transcriptional regulator n=1 Tax=Plastorhodobacter daqingensis TaxID=1387281 RepID=A0ABW2UNA8_9RHOB